MQSSQSVQASQPHLTAAQAADRLGVSRPTVYRRATVLGRKVLGRWRFDPELVEQALAGGAR
jgi:Helix-turn-helix domain